MRKNLKGLSVRFLVFGITMSMLATMVQSPRALAHSYQGQIDDAKDQKKDLEDKREELQKKLKKLESEKGNILTYIEKLDTELNDLSGQIDQLNQEIDEVNAKLTQTEDELEEAKKTEENQYETMKKRIQYMYENGETSMLEVLLNADSIADFLNQVEYVSEITEYDNSLLDRYKDTKQKVEDMKVKLEDTLEEKNLLSEELTMNQSALEEVMDSKQKELKKFESNISDAEALNSEYKKQIADQEKLIEDLIEKECKRIEEEERKRKEEEERKRREEEEKLKQQQQGNNSSGSNQNQAVSTSGFLWPVPSSSRITCEFGYRTSPTAGASSNHMGIDIGASTGSNIVAAQSGTVVTATYSPAAGNYVLISHGNGVFTVYMHCASLLVSAGQSVSRGTVIAHVGSTGISTGPHLHFGVRVNGSYVNPRSYVNP